MTKTNYNEFGEMMVDNRPTMAQFEAEEMGREDWKKYLAICDKIATTSYDFVATNNGNFDNFRSAVHALFSFVGTDTRILAIDGYSIRFISACVPFKVMKSKEYKTAEKNARGFKKAIEWACDVCKVNAENPEAVLFSDITNMDEMMEKHFSATVQNEYNAVVKYVKSAIENGTSVKVADLNADLEKFESIVEELGKEPWQCYKDFKNPMASNGGKLLKHCPSSVRKNIEDVMADILTCRSMMTNEQLEKEEAQIKGGKKVTKK